MQVLLGDPYERCDRYPSSTNTSCIVKIHLPVAEMGFKDFRRWFPCDLSKEKRVRWPETCDLHVMVDVIGQLTILTEGILRVGGAGQVFVVCTIEISQKSTV